MSARPWKARTYDPARLVVAKADKLGGRPYAPGQRFRPDRETITSRRCRQLFDMRVLVTDDEWQRMSGQPVADPQPSQDGDWISEMSRDDIAAQLRELGVRFGPNSKRETLETKLRDALEG